MTTPMMATSGGNAGGIQGNQLPGNRRADIGPHNNPDCLIQRHQSAVHKADNHNGCGRGALDNGSDAGSYGNTEQAVAGQLFQNGFHAVPGSRFQTDTHHMHSI